MKRPQSRRPPPHILEGLTPTSQINHKAVLLKTTSGISGFQGLSVWKGDLKHPKYVW